MMPTEPREHVKRPVPPWRLDDHRTECGRPAAEFAYVLTREKLIAKVRREGIQRAALSTCMTCLQTAQRHRDWAQRPSEVLAREVHWYSEGWAPLDYELVAIAALIEQHREEFDAELNSIRSAVRIEDVRAARARRRGAFG